MVLSINTSCITCSKDRVVREIKIRTVLWAELMGSEVVKSFWGSTVAEWRAFLRWCSTLARLKRSWGDLCSSDSCCTTKRAPYDLQGMETFELWACLGGKEKGSMFRRRLTTSSKDAEKSTTAISLSYGLMGTLSSGFLYPNVKARLSLDLNWKETISAKPSTSLSARGCSR